MSDPFTHKAIKVLDNINLFSDSLFMAPGNGFIRLEKSFGSRHIDKMLVKLALSTAKIDISCFFLDVNQLSGGSIKHKNKDKYI